MRSSENRIARAALLWLVGGATLTLGGPLWHWRVRWERENVVTTSGVYERGRYAGFINNYVYAAESGETHRQSFPLLFPPEGSPFEVQYYRNDPANGWIKRGGASVPLLLLSGVNVLAVLLLLGGTWLARGADPPASLTRRDAPLPPGGGVPGGICPTCCTIPQQQHHGTGAPSHCWATARRCRLCQPPCFV